MIGAKRTRAVLLCLLTMATAGACGSSAAVVAGTGTGRAAAGPVGSRAFTIRTADRRVRSFFVYAFGSAAARRPLVLVYHGAGETAKQAAAETDFVSVAKQDGLIVAFMQGYADTWNEGAGHTPARVAGVDDVQYTAAALSRIGRSYRIDRSRIAAVGFSNGALMTQLLGCRLAGELTAIVPLEGEMPTSISPGCHPRRPISVLEVHGTADPTIPYDGGHFAGVGGGTSVLSAPASISRWAALDRCANSQRTTAGSTRVTTYSVCHAGVAVTLRTIVGGRHWWPPGVGGLISDFLSHHPHVAR